MLLQSYHKAWLRMLRPAQASLPDKKAFDILEGEDKRTRSLRSEDGSTSQLSHVFMGTTLRLLHMSCHRLHEFTISHDSSATFSNLKKDPGLS